MTDVGRAGGTGARFGLETPTIDHVAIATWQLENTIETYVRNFRLTVEHEEDLPNMGVRLAYLVGLGETSLQVIAPIDPAESDRVGLRAFLEQRGEGLHHICFGVSDIDQFVSPWMDASTLVKFTGGKGLGACFLPGTSSGAVVELVETNGLRR